MADISNSKIILAKITQKRNYQKRKLPKKEIICYKIRKYAREILKNTEKIPTGLESAQNAKNHQNIQINCFAG